MNNQESDLNLWKEVIEKAVNIEIKASLQPSSKTKEIESRYPKSYRLLAKKDKDKATWEYWDGDKYKAKSHNPFPANTSQPQT